MRDLIARIISGSSNLKLLWAVWLLALIVLVIVTIRYIIKNYRIKQRLYSRE